MQEAHAAAAIFKAAIDQNEPVDYSILLKGNEDPLAAHTVGSYFHPTWELTGLIHTKPVLPTAGQGQRDWEQIL